MANSNPIKLCECGCGLPTPISLKTQTARGHFAGKPRRFVPGHAGGKRHGMYRSPTYSSWKNMVRRCTTLSTSNAKDYIGRGIQVCERWRVFENFLNDMGERPPNTSLDRIDNNKNYSSDNCRWATKIQQDNNKRTNLMITYQGETLSLSQWSRLLSIHPRTLCNRYHRAGERPPRLFRPVTKKKRP